MGRYEQLQYGYQAYLRSTVLLCLHHQGANSGPADRNVGSGQATTPRAIVPHNVIPNGVSSTVHASLHRICMLPMMFQVGRAPSPSPATHGPAEDAISIRGVYKMLYSDIPFGLSCKRALATRPRRGSVCSTFAQI